MNAFLDMMTDPDSNEVAAQFVRDRIADLVDDPEVAALLTPTDYPIGTKRICVDTDYYATFNRDNVTLVSVKKHPIEQHVDWITDYLRYQQAAGIEVAEADLEAESEWVAHVNEVANHTLYPRAASWYMGANIPGKPRIFMPYVGGVGNYRALCDQVAADGYQGFVHEYARETVSS